MTKDEIDMKEAERLLKLADEFQSYGKIPPHKWYIDLRKWLISRTDHDKYPRL